MSPGLPVYLRSYFEKTNRCMNDVYDVYVNMKRRGGDVTRALTSNLEKARTGLLRGKHTEPVDRIATAGFITFSVAPYGYTNVRALIAAQTTASKALQWKTMHTYIAVCTWDLLCVVTRTFIVDDSRYHFPSCPADLPLRDTTNSLAFLYPCHSAFRESFQIMKKRPVEDPVGHECFFGMEVFVVNVPHYCIWKRE